MNHPKLIAVDVDGTLTDSVCWTVKDCLTARMSAKNKRVADRVRELFKTNFIIIYTARRDHLMEATVKWLRKNDIPFHAYSNNKIPANIYMDDRAINPIGGVKC